MAQTENDELWVQRIKEEVEMNEIKSPEQRIKLTELYKMRNSLMVRLHEYPDDKFCLYAYNVICYEIHVRREEIYETEKQMHKGSFVI